MNRPYPDSVEFSKSSLTLAWLTSRWGGRTAPSRRCKLPCTAGLCSLIGDGQQAGPAALPSITQVITQILRHV